MKHFGIILSILVLLCFAAACMQPEKEVFESAEMQAQKLANGNVITKAPAGSGATIYGGSSGSCVAPTNIIIQQIEKMFDANMNLTGYTIFFIWTPPANAPSSYTVSLTGPNTNVVQNVTSPIFAYNFSLQNVGLYTLAVASNCSNSSSPQLVTSFNLGNIGGGHGGTQITVVDDLDGVMYQQPSGTNFQYNPDFILPTAKFSIRALKLQNRTSLPYTNVPDGNVINVNKSGSGLHTFQFTVPSIVSNIQNTYCVGGNNILLDMTITSLVKVGTIIAYEELFNSSGWNTITVAPMVGASGNNIYTSNITLPNLKRGTIYKVKFFSQFTMLDSYYNYWVTNCNNIIPVLE